MPQLARRIGRAKPSAIMQVAEKAKRLKAEGRDIISFSIGVPNFLPGEHVYAAARDALSKDSGQYGSNRGADALLDAFLEHIAEDRPDRLRPRQRRHRHRRQARASTTWPKRCSTKATRSPSRRRTGPAISTSPTSSTRRSTCCRARPRRTTSSRRRSSTPRWRRSRRCSCSTIRRTRPAWSIRRKRSTRWPTSSRSIRTPGSSPTTSTTAWCSTAWATTTSCTRVPSCATA